MVQECGGKILLLLMKELVDGKSVAEERYDCEREGGVRNHNAQA